jgi:hypothetical protein
MTSRILHWGGAPKVSYADVLKQKKEKIGVEIN